MQNQADAALESLNTSLTRIDDHATFTQQRESEAPSAAMTNSTKYAIPIYAQSSSKQMSKRMRKQNFVKNSVQEPQRTMKVESSNRALPMSTKNGQKLSVASANPEMPSIYLQPH